MPSNAVGNAAETASAPDYNQSIFDFVGNNPVTGGTTPKSGWGSGMAAAAVGAGASLLGGILGNKSQDKALKSQEASNKEAIALQREQMAQQQAQYEQHQRQLQPLLQARYSLLAKYGQKIPMPAQGGMGAGTQPPPIMGGQMPPQGGPAMNVNAPVGGGPLPIRPRVNLDDLANWSNWSGDGMQIPAARQRNPG